MAAVDANAAGPNTAVVEYKASDGDNVEIKSPAKNRYKGTALNAGTTGPHAAAGTGNQRGCCQLPMVFERMSSRWWNPQFDSTVLEEQLARIFMPQTRRRFQLALSYILVASLSWCVYFGVMQQTQWVAFLSGTAVLLVFCLAALVFSLTTVFDKFQQHTAVVVATTLCLFCLLNFVFVSTDISVVGTFTGTLEIILMLYTVIPMPLYGALLVGGTYSVLFELLTALLTNMSAAQYVGARALMHVCIHLMGIHVFIIGQARKRSTFMRVGQSILSRQDLEVEKQIKQGMINSLMPPKVAEEIMKSREKEGEKAEEEASAGPPSNESRRGKPSSSPQRGKISFRTFHMNQLTDVSILFADIVGFTKMSSNKTAEHLVSLLNDLFGRFDVLCEKTGCEKISTLGDCYYCVSGCPEPRGDHAQCCIEMGLAMVKAIQAFDEDHNEQVGMRVGVHTGTVLCGLVGTRRFKFDVWSNDVTLANMMESEGKPGMVHISDSTYEFIKDDYEVEVGEEVADIRKHKVLIEDYNTETQQYQVRHVQEEDTIKTYFILSRKRPVHVGPLSPASPKDKTPGESVDSIKISIEDKEDTQPPDLENTTDTPASPLSPSGDSKHAENQADANGMSPTLLLGRRETLTASVEDVGGEKEEIKGDAENDAALLTQLQAQRAHEQTDKVLIQMMNRDQYAQNYLQRPPINRCTLNFHNPDDEKEFRDHYLTDRLTNSSTFSSPRISAFLDMTVSLLFLALISAACFIGFPIRLPWIIFFSVAIFIEFLMLIPLMVDVFCQGKKGGEVNAINRFCVSWYPRHAFGALLISLPPIAVYSNFSCLNFVSQPVSDMFYCLLVVVSLLHFCNFTMLSSWMKSSLATLAGMVLLILLSVGVCKDADPGSMVNMSRSIDYSVIPGTINGTVPTDMIFHGQHPLRFEIILDIMLLLLLVWFLNREFELTYRLSFHGDIQARNQRKMMQTEKEQADWLLHNIIPQHVSDVLKKTSKYCKNHSDVGVIFAKVTNFDDFYDESFEGGREYLRVLNELISDFEELFDEPQFKDVEKIKTIGSCLMAASGLNPAIRNENKDPKAHLYALVDFSLGLLAKLDQFNLEIFNFDFEMMIGFNTGEVTAGVIGTTKLLYDIWGDTVNISSRMYSTGMRGRIQVTEDTANKLSDKYEFEYRGKTYVKGKGDMNTYLLVKKKEGATWD